MGAKKVFLFFTPFQFDRTESFINLREVSKRLVLGVGRYCIVPSSFSAGEEAEFLLRVFVEKKWGSSIVRGEKKFRDYYGVFFFPLVQNGPNKSAKLSYSGTSAWYSSPSENAVISFFAGIYIVPATGYI